MPYRNVLKAGLLIIFCALLSCKTNRVSQQDFQIETGFELTLVASEPLIQDPVDLEFNEFGDALVLEMPGYPMSDRQSRVKILQDNNHDGLYDTQTLFADSLQMATSILPFKEGVLVAAPPFLLHVKDLNNDYVADAIDTLMGGFSTGNLQHNYNGLTYGLDNWIYAANGGNSGKPYWWGDTTKRMDLRGQDIRFDVQRKVMERIGRSSGGFGLAADNYGRFFETHNLRHISHLVFPDRYIKDAKLLIDRTLANISNHEENGLGRIYPIGEQESRVNHPEQSGYFSGSCGITYYGGGAFGPEYENTVWVADVVLNLIHVDKIEPSGSSFAASRIMEKRDFLASTDRSFRPVNMSVGPDGAMHVVDMYRQVIEHPEWIPDEIEKQLDLNAGKDKGRIYRITRSGYKPTMFEPNQFKSIDGLIASLPHANQWIRKTAHRLLMQKELNEEELRKLIAVVQSPNEMARLHALWILEAKHRLPPELLSTVLHDSSGPVRENALIVAESHIQSDDKVLSECLSLCSDAVARVRMQAGLTLSTLDEARFTQRKDEIQTALLTAAALPVDDWNLAATTLAARHDPTSLFQKACVAGNSSSHASLLISLACFVSNSAPEMITILESIRQARISLGTKTKIISQLAKGNKLASPSKTLLPIIGTLEKTGDIRLTTELAFLRNRFDWPPSPEFLMVSKTALEGVVNNALSDSIRIQQLALLELLPFEKKSDVLFRCIQNSQPLALQEGALRQLSKYQDPTIGWRLTKEWKTMGPAARRLAGNLLLYSKVHHDALLTGLEQGVINIGEMNFDLERRRMLLWWTDDEKTRHRAEKLFSDVGVVNRQEAINKMSEALTMNGSIERGAIVFQNTCSQCHLFGSQGNDVGPVLTEISRKSKESLLHDILDPNAAVDTKYINHQIETNSGEVHLGIVDSETDHQITIKKMGGLKVTINKTDIKSFNSLGSSLMMEGLEGNMKPEDMADLLAYLQNTK